MELVEISKMRGMSLLGKPKPYFRMEPTPISRIPRYQKFAPKPNAAGNDFVSTPDLPPVKGYGLRAGMRQIGRNRELRALRGQTREANAKLREQASRVTPNRSAQVTNPHTGNPVTRTGTRQPKDTWDWDL